MSIPALYNLDGARKFVEKIESAPDFREPGRPGLV
jgi:hypothetical protein